MLKLSFTLVDVAYGILKEKSQTTAFNLESLFGREKSEKNYKVSAPNPWKKLVETLGDKEKYRQSIANAFGASLDVVPEYGVDFSYPMHRATVSTNYAWLPHNLDHEKNTYADRWSPSGRSFSQARRDPGQRPGRCPW